MKMGQNQSQNGPEKGKKKNQGQSVKSNNTFGTSVDPASRQFKQTQSLIEGELEKVVPKPHRPVSNSKPKGLLAISSNEPVKNDIDVQQAELSRKPDNSPETADQVKHIDVSVPFDTGGSKLKSVYSPETPNEKREFIHQSSHHSFISGMSKSFKEFPLIEIDSHEPFNTPKTDCLEEIIDKPGESDNVPKVNVNCTQNEKKTNIFSVNEQQLASNQKSQSMRSARHRKKPANKRERVLKQGTKETIADNQPQSKCDKFGLDNFSSKKRLERVEYELIEENVKAVEKAYDTEIAAYARELYQINSSDTEPAHDNRLKFVDDEESDDEIKPAPKHIYCNIIFFPDKSKGAAPKRYGPKRLGSVYNEVKKEDADNELQDKEFFNSGVFEKSHMRDVFEFRSKDSLNDQCQKVVNANDSHWHLQPVFTETKGHCLDVDVDKTVDQFKHSEADTEINEERNGTSYIEFKENSGQNILADKSRGVNAAETVPIIDSDGDTHVDAGTVKDNTSVKCLNRHANMINEHIQNEDMVDISNVSKPEYREGILKPNVTNKGDKCAESSNSFGSIKKVNICQSPFHMSDKHHVKSATDDLQHIILPNLDFTKLKSKQAKYASQLRSSRTNPGEDNRMILAFNLPAVACVPDSEDVETAEVRDKAHRAHRRNSSGSESDNNCVWNDFDDEDSSDCSDSCNNSFSCESIEDVGEIKEIKRGLSETASTGTHILYDQSKKVVSANESHWHLHPFSSESERVPVDQEPTVSRYSIDVIDKFGSVLREFKRVKTDVENDNRVIITDSKATLAELNDENLSDNLSHALKEEDRKNPGNNFSIICGPSPQNVNENSNVGEVSEDNKPTQDDSFRRNTLQELLLTRSTLFDDLQGLFGGTGLDFHMRRMLARLQDSDEEEEVLSHEDSNEENHKKLSFLSNIRDRTKSVKSKESSEEIQTLIQKHSRTKHRVRTDSQKSPRKEQDETEPVIKLADESDGSHRSNENSTEENDLLFEVLDDTRDLDKKSTFVLPDEEVAAVWSNIFETEFKHVMFDQELPSNSRCTVLCIDISSSMQGAPWIEMRDTLHNFVRALEQIRQEEDVEEHLAVVVFGHETRVALNPTKDYSKILELFDDLIPDGCSPLASGLVLSTYFMNVKELGKCSLTLKGIPVPCRIILFTDGYPTPVEMLQGPDMVPELHNKAAENIGELIEELKGRNVLPIFCVAISDDPNMEFLETLSSNNEGRVIRPANIRDLAKETFNYYIAAHVGGQMLEAAGDEKISMKVFQELVWSVYPSVSHQQAAEIKQIMIKELKRREESSWGLSSDEEGDNLVSDMSVEKKEFLPLGTWVDKGPDFPDLDYGISEKLNRGVVISHNCKQEGAMLIHWDNGMILPCKCGHDNTYEVMPEENPPPPRYDPENPVQVGAMVRRGPDWQYGNQDGGSDQLGTVFGARLNGELLVRWPNGTVGNYRHSREQIYDVLISDPKDPFGRDCYISEMNRRNIEKTEQWP